MIYEKDIKTLNTNYIEKIITRYKKEIIQSKNINDLLRAFYKIVYKMNYFLNIVDYTFLKDEEKDKIIDIINEFNSNIFSEKLTFDNKIYSILEYIHKEIKNIDQDLVDFAIFLVNFSSKDEKKVKLIELINTVKDYTYNDIDVVVKDKEEIIQSTINSTLSSYKILQDYEYYLFTEDIDLENAEIITLKLKPKIYKFLNLKLKDKKERSILKKYFIDQFNDDTLNNPLYVIVCYYMYKNLYIKESNIQNTQYLSTFENVKEMRKFIISFVKDLNDNYISNYIDIFEKNNIEGKKIEFYDLEYYLQTLQNNINKSSVLFDFREVIKYIIDQLNFFDITLEKIDDFRYNIYYSKIFLAQWHFCFNKENGKTSFNILFDRIKMPEGKINIVYLRMNFNCLSYEIQIRNLFKLFDYVGYAVYYTLNLKDSNIKNIDYGRIFKKFFKNIFIYKIKDLIKEQKNKEIIEKSIFDYLNCNAIFKIKKHLLYLLLDVDIFYNKSFMEKIVENLQNEKENQYMNIVSLLIEEYNKCFSVIYDTENYKIIPDISLLFKDFDYKALPFNEYNIIYSDIFSSEFFYNFVNSKLQKDKIFKFINGKLTIEKIIKRKPNYKTLIYGTIGHEKEYKTLTEGINEIMDISTVSNFN